MQSKGFCLKSLKRGDFIGFVGDLFFKKNGVAPFELNESVYNLAGVETGTYSVNGI
jgi:hypothetical protein